VNMIIKTLNNLHETAPRTYTSFPEVAGTSIVRWKNPAGFTASWAVQLGEVGEEQTEVVILGASSPSGTAGTLVANTLYEHPSDTPIYGIKYNQVVFEKATAGTAGTASPITGGTITIQADNKYTIFDDTTGTTTDAWKTYYRNSILGVNTTESDWITSSGPSFYSLAKIRERIKEKLWNPNYLTDDTIDNWINEWQERMRNAAVSVNQDYGIGTANVSLGTDGQGTITTANFKELRRVEINYSGTNLYLANRMGLNEVDPNQTFSENMPKIYMTGENTFGIKPEGVGTARLSFYTIVNPLTNETDEVPTSMKGYTSSFVNYAYSQALFKDQKSADAQTVLGLALSELERFKTELTPRGKLGPNYIRYVEPLSAEEG